MTSSTRLRVISVPRPNQPPANPTFLRSRISRSLMKPDRTSVSPSATRASMSDSIGAGAFRIGLRLSVTTESSAICGVTANVIVSVRTIEGSLLSVSSRGVATIVTLPCASSADMSFVRSVTRSPAGIVRAAARGAGESGPAICAATAAQSTPIAFPSAGSTSMMRASIRTCRCTRSCTASRYSETRSSRSGKSVTCSRPAFRSTLNEACSVSSVCTPFDTSSNTSVFVELVTVAALRGPPSPPIVDDATRSVAM